MPRQLPWLAESKRPPKINVPSGRRRSPLSPDRRSNKAGTRHERIDSRPGRFEDTLRQHGTDERPDRAKSSSPVSPQSPIGEEFMHDGLNGDDIWVMVEDEFLDTAKMFTRHLHRAEYQRLKSLANAQHSDRTDNILRPVVDKGKMSKEQAHKNKAHKTQDAQEVATSKLAGLNEGKERGSVSSDDKDAPWMLEPHLGKLMRRPPSTSRNLASATGIKSNTRAAAGYTKPRLSSPSRRPMQHNTGSRAKNNNVMAGLAKELGMASTSDEDQDEDDLDTPIPSSLTSKVARSHTPRETPAPSRPLQKRPIERSFTLEPLRPRPSFTKSPSIGGRSNTISEIQSSVTRIRPIASLSSSATQDTSSTQSIDAGSARDAMIRRKAARAKKEKEQQKKSYSLDEIPTFLV